MCRDVVRQQRHGRLTVTFHALVGSLLGILVLHPISMVIYWFEFHPDALDRSTFWDVLARRFTAAFSEPMAIMMAVFALIGAILGMGSGVYYRALLARRRRQSGLERELRRHLASLIRDGESETTEFKAAARWHLSEGRVSKELESKLVQTIAGFLNHRGGNLLVGVNDAGEAVGLDRDYATLKRGDRDGYEQFIMRLVKTRIGGEMCACVHVVFHETQGKEVCRVIAEPAPGPAYVTEDGRARYFVRAGNGTRELDAREAIEHRASRWPQR